MISDPDMLYDYAGRSERAYRFDTIFSQTVSNTEVFEDTIETVLPSVLEGFNFTCFAFGMTGAGKTHTMLGDLYGTGTREQGICFMTVDKLFGLIQEKEEPGLEISVKISYLEIYNEQVRDLLQAKPAHLMIVDDPEKGVWVPDLKEISVEQAE